MIICLPIFKKLSHAAWIRFSMHNLLTTNETVTWDFGAKVDFGKEEYSSGVARSANGQLEQYQPALLSHKESI